MKTIHIIVFAIAFLIMLAYGFGGLAFMIVEGVGYEPDFITQIIIIVATLAAGNSFFRLAIKHA
jgi:hypothetical protein